MSLNLIITIVLLNILVLIILKLYIQHICDIFMHVTFGHMYVTIFMWVLYVQFVCSNKMGTRVLFNAMYK